MRAIKMSHKEKQGTFAMALGVEFLSKEESPESTEPPWERMADIDHLHWSIVFGKRKTSQELLSAEASWGTQNAHWRCCATEGLPRFLLQSFPPSHKKRWDNKFIPSSAFHFIVTWDLLWNFTQRFKLYQCFDTVTAIQLNTRKKKIKQQNLLLTQMPLFRFFRWVSFPYIWHFKQKW